MLICAVDLAGRDSRPTSGLPEVQAADVTASQSTAPAADPTTSPEATPVTTPMATPATPSSAHAAQGPAPVFGFGSTGADRHASQAASDEAQNAGMLLSQFCVCLSCFFQYKQDCFS